ncbi:MAG: hypothetical protein U5N86_08010 [Planctomycetota bacterium]|nr:hypothetical protein [Planctomycetota bacterium]
MSRWLYANEEDVVWEDADYVYEWTCTYELTNQGERKVPPIYAGSPEPPRSPTAEDIEHLTTAVSSTDKLGTNNKQNGWVGSADEWEESKT